MVNNKFFKLLAKFILLSPLVIITKNADALIINASFSTDISNSEKSAFNTAAAQFENTFNNNITVNINVNTMATGISSSSSMVQIYNLNSFNYQKISTALQANEPDLFLPSYQALNNNLISQGYQNTLTGLALSNAEVMALGLVNPFLTSTTLDGTISFNSNLTYSTVANANITPGYNLVAIFEHEISEVLGRTSDVPHGTISPLDLLRYTAPNQPSFSSNSAQQIYISTDRGTTNLVNLNSYSSNGDLGDYTGTHDAFNYCMDSLQTYSNNLSNTDISVMEALGYTVVPEPQTYNLMLFGLLGLFYAAKKPTATL